MSNSAARLSYGQKARLLSFAHGTSCDHEDAIIKEISKLCGMGGMAEQWMPCQFKSRPCLKFSDQRKCNKIDTKALMGNGTQLPNARG